MQGRADKTRRQSMFSSQIKGTSLEEADMPADEPGVSVLKRGGVQRQNYNNSMGQGTFADESLFEKKGWSKTVHLNRGCVYTRVGPNDRTWVTG